MMETESRTSDDEKGAVNYSFLSNGIRNYSFDCKGSEESQRDIRLVITKIHCNSREGNRIMREPSLQRTAKAQAAVIRDVFHRIETMPM